MTDGEFVNEGVDLAHLPDLSDDALKGLDENHPLAVLFASLLFSLIPVAVFTLIAVLGNPDKIGFFQSFKFWSGLGALLAIFNTFLFFEARSRRYALRSHDVAYRKGLIWQSLTVVPFARTQHVELHHSPMDRFFDLASVKIFTAGGHTADMEIHGLRREDAQSLRRYMIDRIAAENPSAEAPAPETEPEGDGD